MESAGFQIAVKAARTSVPVSPEDAEMIKKVHRILGAGKNVEIKQESSGNPKVFKVSREIEK